MSATANTQAKLTEKITCKLEVLTPVHVGAALAWNEGIEFVQKDQTVFLIDIDLYLKTLMETTAQGNRSGYDELIALLSSGKTGNVGELCEKSDIDLKDIAIRTFSINETMASQIKPLIRNGTGKTYIPGSSIKGAMRSALFNYLYRLKGITGFVKKSTKESKNTEEHLFGEIRQSITRFLHPFDVELSQSTISNLRTFNLYFRNHSPHSDYKQDLPISIEYFVPGSSADFRLAIDEPWINKIYAANKKSFSHNITELISPDKKAIPNLFHLINAYTFDHINREIEFLATYPQAEDSEFVIENLESLQKMTLNNTDSCILRLGFGGGFHSITGDWKYENHTDPIDRRPDWDNQKNKKPTRYKTRKIAGRDLDATLMGFVKITLPEGYERVPQIHKDLPGVSSARSIKATLSKPASQGNEVKSTVPQKIELAEVVEKMTPYSAIVVNLPFQAKVIRVQKPFPKVTLLIESYPFENIADLMGSKGVVLEEGQIIQVFISPNTLARDGQIKSVMLKK